MGGTNPFLPFEPFASALPPRTNFSPVSQYARCLLSDLMHVSRTLFFTFRNSPSFVLPLPLGHGVWRHLLRPHQRLIQPRREERGTRRGEVRNKLFASLLKVQYGAWWDFFSSRRMA